MSSNPAAMDRRSEGRPPAHHVTGNCAVASSAEDSANSHAGGALEPAARSTS